MRAIAALGCEGVMRAIASSMSSHVNPQQGPTPILSVATAGSITTVQTVSAAATTLPTTPFLDAARVKGYCSDRAILTLLRCTTDELFFSYCYSAVAHFKRAACFSRRCVGLCIVVVAVLAAAADTVLVAHQVHPATIAGNPIA